MSATFPSVDRAGAYAGGYGIRDVARLVGLPPGRILAFVRSGAVAPGRGPRQEYRFAFPDLVLLRTARDLLERLPPRKLHRALRRLRERLPRGRQLATMRIVCQGEDLVVREGRVAWLPESGQALLDLDVAALATEVAPLARRAAEQALEEPGAVGGDDWYRLGCDLEVCAPAQAMEAYRRTLDADPDHVDARLNLGRLLHELGQVGEAERHYREVLARRPDDVTAAFNLGVALQDLGRAREAVAAYERALDGDPGYADAHFNLSRLAERLGDRQGALRHLQEYRRLAGVAPG